MPRPNLPTPALLETQVRFLTSGRLASAPMSVSAAALLVQSALTAEVKGAHLPCRTIQSLQVVDGDRQLMSQVVVQRHHSSRARTSREDDRVALDILDGLICGRQDLRQTVVHRH